MISLPEYLALTVTDRNLLWESVSWQLQKEKGSSPGSKARTGL